MAALKLEKRDGATKPKALRRNGILPIAVTRRNHTTVEVQAPLLDLTNAIKGSDAHGRFEVVLPEAGKMRVILKQQDIDYVHQRPLHATLMEVGDDDVIKLDVPVIEAAPFCCDEARVVRQLEPIQRNELANAGLGDLFKQKRLRRPSPS